MKRQAGSAAVALLLCLAAAQLVRPTVGNPPVNPARSLWNDSRVDSRVAKVLKRACANCHSHETEWPWYSQVSPVSWMLARDVRRARAKLNFSEWSGARPNQLEDIADAIDKHEMPPASYGMTHPESRLSKADRELLDA